MTRAANNYYNKIAKIYDLMYTKESGFDHAAQVLWVDDWRKKLGLPKEVLDLACGTGVHLGHFNKLGYTCQGIDASQGMLTIAKKRLKGVPLKKGFFENFSVKKPVPVITSYFNAMSYNTDVAKLETTFRNVYKYLQDGGIFVFDMFCKKSKGADKPVFVVKNFEVKGLKMSRTIAAHNTKEGFKSTMYYVLFDGKKSEIIAESSVRGVFTEKLVLSALKAAGFKTLYNGGGYAPEYNVFVAQK